MTTLADQIIDLDDRGAAGAVTHAWINDPAALQALRHELLELRQRRQADERREQFEVEQQRPFEEWITCTRCSWGTALDTLAGPITLAELNRRADQHGEECR